MQRANDAVAAIQRFGTKGYQWVLDADLEACFDSISQAAPMGRVGARVKDKRVLTLVKAAITSISRCLSALKLGFDDLLPVRQ
jgi:RNA-directed DNA polymerase